MDFMKNYSLIDIDLSFNIPGGFLSVYIYIYKAYEDVTTKRFSVSGKSIWIDCPTSILKNKLNILVSSQVKEREGEEFRAHHIQMAFYLKDRKWQELNNCKEETSTNDIKSLQEKDKICM